MSHQTKASKNLAIFFYLSLTTRKGSEHIVVVVHQTVSDYGAAYWFDGCWVISTCSVAHLEVLTPKGREREREKKEE